MPAVPLAEALNPNLLAGTPYVPIAILGRGGMGEVIEAKHIFLNKIVVVKLLHEQLRKRSDFVDRMRLEAQSLANLSHPNIVAVTDFGHTAEDRPFLVMERLYGRTLREELHVRGSLSLLEALEIMQQALSGIAVAHEAGIVHRDLKLDNLFLCDHIEGRRLLKILDFGIAKIVSERSARTPRPLAFPTEEGVAVGTPRFFSPEQARGKPVDARTDVYALGLVLYTLLAGRGPFEHRKGLVALMRAHANETPEPPSRHAAQYVPPDLDAAILKALAKAPNDRFPGAAAFSGELGLIAQKMIRDFWCQGIPNGTSGRPQNCDFAFDSTKLIPTPRTPQSLTENQISDALTKKMRNPKPRRAPRELGLFLLSVLFGGLLAFLVFGMFLRFWR